RQRGVASVLERMPGHFQKDSMRRIHDRRIAGAETEEGGVKLVSVIEHRTRLHVVRIVECAAINTSGQQLFITKATDRLDAMAEVRPEFIDGRGARKARGHADNGDVCRAGGGFMRYGHQPGTRSKSVPASAVYRLQHFG